ncbi:nucleotide exchange factor GrpE [Halapricum desulfuricans]|nr:nucleotide exchange factor GrpE [Halapricum desulfuricans]QSG11250.1 Molecular chaperone GrpE (heat shock protein) [Halapricum desulfuricans]
MTDQEGMSDGDVAERDDERSEGDDSVATESDPNGETAPAGDGSEAADSGADDGVSDDETPEEIDDSEDGGSDDDVGLEGTESEVEDDLDVAEELVEHVESSDPEAIADEIASLRFEVEALEAERDDYEEEVESLRSRLKRKQADFENYKKRMQKRREEEKARATEDLVTRLLDVRDNLKRALEQDEDADIRDGIETTLKQFDRVLEDENVESIEPERGDEVDPERHEVLVRMDSDQPEGTIADVHRPGYEMGGKVIRTAQVAVSDGDE